MAIGWTKCVLLSLAAVAAMHVQVKACPTQAASGILDAGQVARWAEDSRVFERELETRHIDLFHQVTRIRFRQELEGLRQRLPGMSEPGAIVDLMRIARLVGDGHTAVPLWDRAPCRFPLELRIFRGKAYVIGAGAGLTHLLGAELLSINDVPAYEAQGRVGTVAGFVENDYSAAVRTAEQLVNAEVLDGLGLSSVAGTTRFELYLHGRRASVALRPSGQTAIVGRLALHLPGIRPVLDESGLSAGLIGRDDTLYLQFRRYPGHASMALFADRVRDLIDRMRIRQLVIDMRGNTGGDFFVGLRLAQALIEADGIDWKAGVYLLTDHASYSAAVSNAVQFSQMLNARRIGEPTGGRPSGYQDLGQFRLPHSGLVITYSKRVFRFGAGGADALLPDVRIESTIDDYRGGRDRVVEWVLDDISARRQRSASSAPPHEHSARCSTARACTGGP